MKTVYLLKVTLLPQNGIFHNLHGTCTELARNLHGSKSAVVAADFSKLICPNKYHKLSNEAISQNGQGTVFSLRN